MREPAPCQGCHQMLYKGFGQVPEGMLKHKKNNRCLRCAVLAAKFVTLPKRDSDPDPEGILRLNTHERLEFYVQVMAEGWSQSMAARAMRMSPRELSSLLQRNKRYLNIIESRSSHV